MLAFLGRVHTAAQGEAAIQAAYAAGIHNLSLDLMYGLPGQHLADVRRDVDACFAWSTRPFTASSSKTGRSSRRAWKGDMAPAA